MDKTISAQNRILGTLFSWAGASLANVHLDEPRPLAEEAELYHMTIMVEKILLHGFPWKSITMGGGFSSIQ